MIGRRGFFGGIVSACASLVIWPVKDLGAATSGVSLVKTARFRKGVLASVKSYTPQAFLRDIVEPAFDNGGNPSVVFVRDVLATERENGPDPSYNKAQAAYLEWLRLDGIVHDLAVPPRDRMIADAAKSRLLWADAGLFTSPTVKPFEPKTTKLL